MYSTSELDELFQILNLIEKDLNLKELEPHWSNTTALCGGYNHSTKHCFKGEHDINDIMEKMNINRHQSKQSGLYS